MTTAPLNAQLTGERLVKLEMLRANLQLMVSTQSQGFPILTMAVEIDEAIALAKSALSAEAPVEQDFWWLIENRSGGQLLYATCDSGDKRWTFNAPEAARFKTEAAAYNCMVQMRLAFHEHNGGYSGEKISAQQHGFIYTHPVPAAPQAFNTVFLIDGKPHRPCDCPLRSGDCPKGRERKLMTTELSRCFIPDDAAPQAVGERDALPQYVIEEFADGDKICSEIGLDRTEGGRLPMYKILAAIRDKK